MPTRHTSLTAYLDGVYIIFTVAPVRSWCGQKDIVKGHLLAKRIGGAVAVLRRLSVTPPPQQTLKKSCALLTSNKIIRKKASLRFSARKKLNLTASWIR
jgi:hypothetical protein